MVSPTWRPTPLSEVAVKRKRLLMLVGAVLAGATAAAAWLCYSPEDQARRAKFSEIRVGMTLPEVEALMGRPFDGQSGMGTALPADIQIIGREMKGWDGPGSLTIDVVLDHQDVVVYKRLRSTWPTGWDRVRWLVEDWLQRVWP
jgi:hypothetical protein